MTNEFKKVKNDNETRYVLETATAGATSAGVVATAPGKKREDSILAQEANKKKETDKPRNFVAKNAKMGGAGKMQDKSKIIPRKEKHKKPVAEGYYDLPNQGNVPGMEPIDFSSKPSFKELITRYTQLVYQGHASETSPEEDQEYDAIEKYVAQRFGEKGSAHLQKAGEVSYWGRNDKPHGRDSRSSNLGRPNQPSGDFRTTKAGKMHGQDAKIMKAKVANRLGRHPEPNLPEGFNGEYDDEAGMAHSNLLTTARAVMGLLKTIKDRDNLPEWGQEKIAKAEMMLVSVWDYLQSQKELGNDPQVEGYGRYDRRDAYQRDYDHSVAGMDRGNNHRDDERHDLDPTDWYVVKDGKMFAVSVYPNQEQEAMARGYSRTRDEAKAKASKQGVAEGSAHGYNVAKWYEKNGDQLKLTRWLRKEAGLPKDAPVYFDDADLVYGDKTIVPGALVNPKLKFNDLLTALTQATGGQGKQNVDGVYRESGAAEIDTYIESLAESLQEVLSEKAVSKKQQKFMGMVHAAQKGEKPASKEVAKVAKDMGKKDAKDFASTKHKGLPEKKKAKK
jgi:hypothetical protein